MNKNYHLEKYKEFSALLLLVVWTWKITFDPGQFQFPKKTNPMTDNFSRKRGCWKILWGLGTTFSKMIYWTSALRCIEENKASSTYSSPPKLQYFSLLQGLKKMEWKMPYLFLTTPLSIRSISWACHLQNRQLASISPRSTTWPFDLASANGFTCFIDQEWGRWHIFALSVSTKNESDATKIDVVIACIALRSSSPKLQLPAEASTMHNKH